MTRSAASMLAPSATEEGLTTPGPMAPSNQTPMWTDGLRTGAPEGSGVMFGYQSGLQAHGHSGDTRSFGYTQTGNSVGFPIGHNGQHGYMSGGCLSNHGPTSSLGGQP
ncbi:unnamed protein product [Ostreobium quekettii]|uniref:Uncharacterized protein n=1 Tax=Ostreobium quekettii TaxID=121088 RepID=A0A8S1J005_9CHLO|nr:unnamed protein product [Ostreobium quekettii]